ncbi:hypothetical protein BZG36_05762, partial [Bifiguratus adelaidae]
MTEYRDPEYKGILRHVTIAEDLRKVENQLKELEKQCLIGLPPLDSPSMRSRVGSLKPTIDGYSRTSDEAYTSWNEEEQEQEDHIDWHVRLTPSGFRFTSNIHTFKDMISQLNRMEQILRVRRQSENPLRDNLLTIQTTASQWLGVLRSVTMNITIGHHKVNNQGDLLSRTLSTEKLMTDPAYTRLHTGKIEAELNRHEQKEEKEEDNMFRAAVANKQAPFILPISLFHLMVNNL